MSKENICFTSILIALWVYKPPTDWTAGVKSPAEESVKNASETQIVFYPIRTGGSFPGGRDRGVNLTTHLHLRLHGVVLN
jgi:hypothetical protein